MAVLITKTYLPPIAKFKKYLCGIYSRGQITNGGPLVHELEERLKLYLGVKNILLVTNGTLALQVAYKLLELKGEVITTPFSFVATTSSLLWNNLTPAFSDINQHTFNLDPQKISSKINSKTTAILPVHVFGNPCEMDEIQRVATRHRLKVIYDAAHAFGVTYAGQSCLNYGDVSIISFHATKLFHTIEGGALIIKDDLLYHKAKRIINFGYDNFVIKDIGINAKMSEFYAAMGLCVLDDIKTIRQQREEVWHYYYNKLKNSFEMQEWNKTSTQNYHYFPIIPKTVNHTMNIATALLYADVHPRRYFHPSLDSLDYIKPKQHCALSRALADKILCLPLYPSLNRRIQKKIVRLVCEARE